MSQIGALFKGLWGDAGEEFVNEQGGADKVFGTKPDVAPFKKVDLAKQTGIATAGNLANFDQVTEFLNKLVPGFSDLLAKSAANSFSELGGVLPEDVMDQVMRNSAYQSLMGGFGGTGMAKALTARDLGLTSLNLTEMGAANAARVSDIAQTAYSPFTVGTAQQAAVTAANNIGEQATKQFKFNVEAAPDPGAQGIFNLDAALGQQMLSLGLGAAGGAYGGGGGGGGGGYQAPVTSYGIAGGVGNAPAYQYDPRTGQYSQPVPRATGAWSDRRLKTDLVLVGKSASGIKIYEFSYDKEEGPGELRFRGALADEVMDLHPEAVTEVEGGYLVVDYGFLDVKLEVI